MLKGVKYHQIYLATLLCIALLVVVAVMIIDNIAAEEVMMIKIDDVGGQQLMLSERITHLTLEYVSEPDGQLRSSLVGMIEQSLERFAEAHYLLITGELGNGQLIPPSSEIDRIFFDSPEYLDEKARIFIYNTREVLAAEWTPEIGSNYYLEQVRKSSIESLHASLKILSNQYAIDSLDRVFELRKLVVILLGGVILALVGAGIFVFRPLFQKITLQEQELKGLAFTDSLIGCQNHRSFLTNADKEFNRSRRYNRPFSILFVDVDEFKDINDIFGHALGDQALIQLADIFQNSIRSFDFLGRIGGDEFGIVLPETDTEKASLIAEKLRKNVSEFVCSGELTSIELSVSIGVATIDVSDNSAFDTLNRADQNLYTSKRSGRNKVVV